MNNHISLVTALALSLGLCLLSAAHPEELL